MKDLQEQWYSDLRVRYRFDELLNGPIDCAWNRCELIWRERGRIEDKPFGIRFTKYSPWWGKYLAQEFAYDFRDEYAFLFRFLDASDQFKRLAAIELLGYMAGQFKVLPPDLANLENPIPLILQRELDSDWITRDYSIKTVGSYASALHAI